MKPAIIFTIVLFSLTVQRIKGQTASELFAGMPESELLPLTISDRLDLIDLYKAGQKAVVKNSYDDSCSVIRLTNDYIEVQVGNSTTELFLLPMINDSKIVGLIQTVCAPVCDSYLDFYTIAWKKLTPSIFVTLAGPNDFLKEGINQEDEEVKNALIPLDIVLSRLHYDPDKQELQQYYTTPDYLSEKDKASAMSYLKDTPKLFKWNHIRFE